MLPKKTQAIGFANKYYTLWEVWSETEWFTDSYGKHWPVREVTHYNYIKNVSFDIEKVKSQYPGVPINEDLKGKTQSWEKSSSEDLSPEIFKFGKYSGYSIDEIAEKDLEYIIYIAKIASSPVVRELCSINQKVVDHFNQISQQRESKIHSLPKLQSGKSNVRFVGNPNRSLYDNYGYNPLDHWNFISKNHDLNNKELANKKCAAGTIGEGHSVYVLFDEVLPVAGLYPYNNAVINSRQVKVKGKTLELNLEIIATFYSESDQTIVQIAILKQI